MESDEKYIEARFGKAQPFKVPDGYFDSLVQSVMENADEQVARDAPIVSAKCTDIEKDSAFVPMPWWKRYRRYCAAAACGLLVVGGVSSYLAFSHDSAGAVRAVAATSCDTGTESHVQSSSSYDEEIDYTMLDNEGLYSLMASN